MKKIYESPNTREVKLVLHRAMLQASAPTVIIDENPIEPEIVDSRGNLIWNNILGL